MNEEISKANEIYINDWFSLNHNLNDLKFENNTIVTASESINLGNFLVADLLTNNYFNTNKYSISKKEFLTILKLHVTADKILNDKEVKTPAEKEKDLNEYIINIKLSPNGYLTVITNKEIHQLNCPIFNRVLIIYNELLVKFNYYVPFHIFYEDLKNQNLIVDEKKEKAENENIPKYLELLHKQEGYSLKEYNYLNSISSFMFKLLCNEEYLCATALSLLNIYKYEMNNLSNKEIINSNEAYLLDQYDKNIKDLQETQRIAVEKEALSSRASSFGFSSLFLIISSVLLSGFVLALFLILK